MASSYSRSVVPPTPSAPPALVPATSGDYFQAFVNAKANKNVSQDEKEAGLQNIWKNATPEMRQRIENEFPGTEEQYGATRRRRSSRKTKKTKRNLKKKTHKRRH